MQITNATASQALSSRRNLHFHLCFGGQGGDVGACPLQPVPAWECKRWRFLDLLLFLGKGKQPAITKGLFSGPKKVRKIGNVTAGLLSSRFGAVDAGCMRIDFADMGLQRFSTSVHVKGPKTDPPGGTTFDSKRVHFWIPFEIDFLSPRV